MLARRSTENLPLIDYRSWWRTLLAYLIAWAPGLAIGGWIVLGLGWRPLGNSWLVTLVIIAYVMHFLIRLMVGVAAQRVFRSARGAYQLLSEGHYPEAVAGLRVHLAFLEKHPFLDRWRTVLFLDRAEHGVREKTWLNIAFAAMQSDDVKVARDAYHCCLEINPSNEMAIDSLNFIAVFAGEPLRSGGSGLTFCHVIDPGEHRRRANITLIVILVTLFGYVPVAGSLMMLLRQSIVAWLMPQAPWILATFVSVWVWYLLLDVLMKIYRWAATHMVLFDLYRADRLTRTGRSQEAIQALEVVQAFFSEHPWVDGLRWILLLSPTTYSYQEWVSISLADVHLDRGDVDRYIHFSQECLAQNPKNAFARKRLRSCNTILAALNKPLIQIPAPG